MKINSQLLSDCHQIISTENILILLHKNASLPWFILVPYSDEQEYRELFELPAEIRNEIDSLSDKISRYLVDTFNAYKINIAAIGNIVEQLHLHIIARYEGDVCWPNPVWGNLTDTKEYEANTLQKIVSDVTVLANTSL